MLLYYISKIVAISILKGQPFKKTDLYKGFNLYKNTNKKERKNIFKVLFEMEKLSWYWRSFPESYFMFCMHLNSFNDYELMKSYVTQGFYDRYAGSTEYDILINDKILFHDIMESYNLPVPKLFFVFRNNKFYIKNRVVSDSKVNETIENITDDRIFAKRYRGGGGSGVFIFTKKENRYYDIDNNKMSAEFIRQKYYNNTILFEKQIIQEPVLRAFNPDTVNTLRVLVNRNRNKDYQIISSAARFGKKGDYMDNAAKGGIVVSLDIETGVLGEYGERHYNLSKYFEHPDSKIAFKGVKIKQWVDAKKLVYKVMEYLPYYKIIAFDIATTDNGPVIIEINTGVGMKAVQMAKEKGISEHFH